MVPVEATVARVRVPAVDEYELATTVTRPKHGADDWVIVSGAVAGRPSKPLTKFRAAPRWATGSNSARPR